VKTCLEDRIVVVVVALDLLNNQIIVKALDKIYANQSLGLRNMWNCGYFLVLSSFFQYSVLVDCRQQGYEVNY
jgi:hypothetical protein